MKENERTLEPDRSRKLLPPRALLLSLLAQIPLVLWSWPLELTRTGVLIGVGVLILGVVLNVWSERLFRNSGVGVCPFSAVQSLVNQGPYRFTRNPMYLGLVLVSASACLITGLQTNLWAVAALAVWLHFRFVLREEDFLTERLGVSYLAYASRIPRWLGLPGPRVVETATMNQAVEPPEVAMRDL